MVKADYDYPDEFGDLRRRARRRAKKEWRRDDHGQRMQWLRQQRQAEPVSPVSVLVVVLLLGIIILGIGGGLPKIVGGSETKQPVGLLTPADPLPLPTVGRTAAPGSSAPIGGADSTPPPQTVRPSPSATMSATDVVGQWARKFYTRNPAAQSYDELVDASAEYMTAELAASFVAQGDSTYEALKAEGGTSKVASATVTAPKAGTAPTDTTGRISRFLNVVIDISGTKPQRITVPLLITVVLQDNTWVISDVDGGTGP